MIGKRFLNLQRVYWPVDASKKNCWVNNWLNQTLKASAVLNGHHGSAGYPSRSLKTRAKPHSNKEEDMTKMILMVLLVVLCAGTESFGQTNLHTDSFGNTTGTIDGQRVNLHTDRFGNTTGTVGGQRYNTHTDNFGNTSGSSGDSRINTHRDSFGNRTGTIGNQRLNTHTDEFGNTTGSFGNRRINRHTDSFGNTTGR